MTTRDDPPRTLIVSTDLGGGHDALQRIAALAPRSR